MTNLKTKNTSNQWIVTYHTAIIKAWKHPDFKNKLISETPLALQELGFTIPKNMSIEFKEIDDNDYSVLPEFNLSVFDKVQTKPVHVKVPIPPKPEDLSDSLEHLYSPLHSIKLGCCCFCG
jgi:hypothetical protein